MLDRTIGVTDIDRARAFYDQALRPFDIQCLYTVADSFAGYGDSGRRYFWIGQRTQPQTGTHIAFGAPDRMTVAAFHAAAFVAGGTDNGPPGPRPHATPTTMAPLSSTPTATT
jgi:hypothetical protein